MWLVYYGWLSLPRLSFIWCSINDQLVENHEWQYIHIYLLLLVWHALVVLLVVDGGADRFFDLSYITRTPSGYYFINIVDAWTPMIRQTVIIARLFTDNTPIRYHVTYWLSFSLSGRADLSIRSIRSVTLGAKSGWFSNSSSRHSFFFFRRPLDPRGRNIYHLIMFLICSCLPATTSLFRETEKNKYIIVRGLHRL